MTRRAAMAVAGVLALVAMAAPVVLSISLASRQATARERAMLLQFARAAVLRNDDMLDRIAAAFAELEGRHDPDPCSEASVERMRHLDLAAAYVQAIGRVSGNVMTCSSIRGTPGTTFDLGPPDASTPNGWRVRFNAVLPFAPEHSFLVVESGGFAAIVHRDLVVEPPTDDPRVSMATFSRHAGRIAAARGFVRADWIGRLQGRDQVVFEDGDYLVAVAASRRYLTGALAASPRSSAQRQTLEFARVLVPIGVLAGLLLAAATLYFARQQQSMPALIRSGLRRGEFFLQYQPIVELATSRCVGAEVLMRWRRGDGEMVRPDVFIQVAEDSGQIRKITEYLMDRVGDDAGDLFRAHPGFHLALNLSAQGLQCPTIVASLTRLAARTGAAAGNLMVEATERGFLNDGLAAGIVRQLRELGFEVAVDDFGTGYSSLSYLHNFALDYLKIDKSFVDTIGAEAATSQVVSHIIGMARDLKLGIIAEGVETRAQADYLRERGVQYAQGWLFGKPMPMDELRARLEAPGLLP